MLGFVSKRRNRGKGLGGASSAAWNAFQRSGVTTGLNFA